MLNRFINIINSSTVCIVEDSIFISNHIINDLDCLNSLDTQECINSFNKNGNIVTFADLVIGDTINIELSLLHLMAIGYYENLESFIRKNPYSIPAQLLYIRDINSFSDGNNNEIDYYKNVIYLINAIKSNARHCYSEIEIDISWIFREDKVLLLPFIYDNTDIIQITNIDKIKSVSLMLSEMDTDKKFIYINELIDFLSSENENRRFKFLLSHIAEFADRANNAYQYYIRNFSYNKLKTELDNAALDYSKKIQSV
ncbi:MAG: hypothetical protein LBQ28_07010, partial [Prevotellaceae bacterium]|nr:hypothetical protein [Prevotellaceae bacterium]